MNKILSKVKSVLFSKKEIICISNNGIKSKKFGFMSILFGFSMFLWAAFTSASYFQMRQILITKELEISKLKTNKQNLLVNVKLLEKSVNNIETFIVSLNKYDRFSSVSENLISEENLYNSDKNVNIVLNRLRDNVKNVNSNLVARIKGIEDVKNKLNLKNGVELVSYNQNSNDIEFDDQVVNKDVQDSIILKKTLDNNIENLAKLESFINTMPFSEPMDYGYVSSKFGKRLDPFLKIPREHHGVDLVGSYMAKVYAPADGKVIFVGQKTGYGNVIMIEHEYGVKTVYGHLSKFFAKVGDNIKRGDVIGNQGSTGRSTGQHLHYEIVMNGERYNPMNFIKFGDNFYFDSSI